MERINTDYTENNALKSKAKLFKPFNHDVATRPKPPLPPPHPYSLPLDLPAPITRQTKEHHNFHWTKPTV